MDVYSKVVRGKGEYAIYFVNGMRDVEVAIGAFWFDVHAGGRTF